MSAQSDTIAALLGAGISWFGVKAVCGEIPNIILGAFRLFVYAGQGEASDNDAFVASCSNSNPAKAELVLGAIAGVWAYNRLNSQAEQHTPQMQNS